MKQKALNTKVILGNIGAVILIVLSSLNPVLGNQDTKKGSAITSPLFRIRIDRAVDTEEETVLQRRFIGMGEDNKIVFKSQHLESEIFIQVMYTVCTMNDESYKKFVELSVNKLLQEDSITENDVPKLKELFLYFRENPNQIEKFPLDKIDEDLVNLYTSSCVTLHDCSTIFYTPISCLIIMVMLIVTFPIWFPIYTLQN
jgi:hypothetical protein